MPEPDTSEPMETMTAGEAKELLREYRGAAGTLFLLLVVAVAFGGWQWYQASIARERLQPVIARAEAAEMQLGAAQQRAAVLESDVRRLTECPATLNPSGACITLASLISGYQAPVAAAPAASSGALVVAGARCIAGDMIACIDVVTQLLPGAAGAR